MDVLDWRRRVAALYAQVRAEPDPRAAHELWRTSRDGLLRTHPASPVPQAVRAAYPGAPVAPYDEALRFEGEVDTDVEPARLELNIDLNFAYNPSCAYDPAWACPLAPPGNTLKIPVGAGELMPGS